MEHIHLGEKSAYRTSEGSRLATDTPRGARRRYIRCPAFVLGLCAKDFLPSQSRFRRSERRTWVHQGKESKHSEVGGIESDQVVNCICLQDGDQASVVNSLAVNRNVRRISRVDRTGWSRTGRNFRRSVGVMSTVPEFLPGARNCFMGFLVDPQLKNPRTLFKASGPSLLPRGTSGPTLAQLQ